MKAVIVEQAGGPEVLQLREVPVPQLRSDWVLIRVKAFGLNRSEMFTRQGHSPGVKFPRVLGIECVGIVEDASNTNLAKGQTVAAVMGGMGRDYDGGYAEYTLVPAQYVMPIQTGLDWSKIGAIPEMYLTAWGSLVEAMEIQAGRSLLVRGGTSSVGLASISLAKAMGLTVAATTRNPSKAETLHQNGADHVIIDQQGQIAEEVHQIFPGGANYVLELVGATTLLDSLKATAPKGIVCNSGIVGNEWRLANFEPMTDIPSTVKLTNYSTETVTAANSTAALQKILDGVAAGQYKVNIDRVFRLNKIVEAHRYMEENRAQGKLVVVID